METKRRFQILQKNDGSLRIVSSETNIIKGVDISHTRVKKMVVLKKELHS